MLRESKLGKESLIALHRLSGVFNLKPSKLFWILLLRAWPLFSSASCIQCCSVVTDKYISALCFANIMVIKPKAHVCKILIFPLYLLHAINRAYADPCNCKLFEMVLV